MGLIDLTADLTYNSNFETEPIENQQQPVSGEFQTSDLESSPTEEIGSVNFFQNPHGANEDGSGGFSISGFTQFMDYPDTLYPGEGLNNSGVVDHFPNPHNYDGDTGFEIEGFTANMQKYETLYPSKDNLEISGINNGIVDFFPSPHGIGHFGAETQSPHNIEGFVADVQPLSDGFYPNTIELGSVDFFPGGNFSNNFLTSTGFTQNAEPFGESKIETEFKMIGEGNVLNEDFMNNELFQSINTLGTYKGAVNFISDSDSYATGFTKNMQPIDGDKLDTQYDIEQFYTDESLSFSVTSGIPNPSVTTYSISDSILVGTVDEVENQFSVYSLDDFQLGAVAGLGLPTDDNPFTYDDLKGGMMSFNVDGFNIESFDSSNFGDNVTGPTSYGVSLNSNFATDVDVITDTPNFRFNSLNSVFQSARLAGVVATGSFDNSALLSQMNSLNINRPTQNISSGPYSSDSGFSDGSFKLQTERYQSSDSTDNEEFQAVQGSISREMDGDIRLNGTTLFAKFDDGKGTDFRDLSNMSAGDYDYPSAPFGYSDGVSNGAKFGSMYGSFGLIDKKIDEVKAGLTPDFFIRESGGGRFLGRIVKDLERTLKRTLSPAGLLGLGKEVVMNFFQPSDKSLYTSLVTRFTAANLGQYGIRGASVGGNILELVTNSLTGVGDKSLALYENRVDNKHPSQSGIVGSLLTGAAALVGADVDRTTRTLTTRYGQPKYPVHKPLSGAVKAHELYSGGMLDSEKTRAQLSVDDVNILSYGQGYGEQKDLIKFGFKDIRNGKWIIFRAFLTNIQDSVSPEWNNYRYIGRPDDVYVYKGTTRSLSFSLKVAAFSRREMIPMWERINYLVGLNYGSYVDTNVYQTGDYYQGNPGMSSPICLLTLGDYVVEQTGYIKDFNISIPPEYPWDTIIDDGGSNVVGELPQVVDINMGFQIIPKQIPDSYGKHFGKVGLRTSEVSSAGLPWLSDLYTNVPALSKFKDAHDDYLDKNKITLPDGNTPAQADITNSEEPQKQATDTVPNPPPTV